MAPAPEPEPAIDFQLSFIFFSPSFRRAVIDGRLVREGDWLPGGFRLVSIHDTSIVVRNDQTMQRIELPTVFPEPPIFIMAPAEPPSAPPVVAPPVAQPGAPSVAPRTAPRISPRIPRIGPRAPQVAS
ncbi:MAG: general secretion pathway protein GspB [Planctomycetota bacterium]|nr:general secretion pathway protein GspB [Planctomycetota bacterium]